MKSICHFKRLQSYPKKPVLFYFFVLGAFVISLVSSSDGFAKANHKYASLVMDADTGMILSQRYADHKRHPASLTKIMTLALTFDALEQGRITLDTRIRISRRAAGMVPSKLGLPAGSTIKVKDAIYSLVTKSANDIAVALAEHLGGTEYNFATMMTRKARYIGMRNTVFRNASGLHDPKQVSTARDMALLARYVINRYPDFYRYFSTRSFTYHGKTYRNHNKLLGSYKGMDGMKTGYINASGFNLVASAVRNNRRIIGVVFGGRSGKTRNAHMVNLLDNGFTKMNDIRVAKAQVPLPPRKPEADIALALANDNLNLDNDSNAQSIQLASMGPLIGEGDYDIQKIRRIETGMMAIAAHTNKPFQPFDLSDMASIEPAVGSAMDATGDSRTHYAAGHWSVQLGAFTSRQATNKMLYEQASHLPPELYNHAQKVVAPLKTRDGWLFRGRLSGLSQTQAKAVCGYVRECMVIAPNNH